MLSNHEKKKKKRLHGKDLEGPNHNHHGWTIFFVVEGRSQWRWFLIFGKRWMSSPATFYKEAYSLCHLAIWVGKYYHFHSFPDKENSKSHKHENQNYPSNLCTQLHQSHTHKNQVKIKLIKNTYFVVFFFFIYSNQFLLLSSDCWIN